MKALVVALFLLVPATAFAYPQFQPGDGITCSGCHISPSGGGLLTEMGKMQAADISQFPGDPEFLHGLVPTPNWLTVSGDVRAAGGIKRGHEGIEGAFFPMQLELGLAAQFGEFTVYGTVGGGKPREDDTEQALMLREHYLMWHHGDSSETGLYVRAGRMMPTFGLRLAEHVFYVRQYVQPLFAESYGVGISYISEGWEIHANGFIHDELRYSSEQGDGGTLYAEKRFGMFSVGLGGRILDSDFETRTTGALTGKWHLPDCNLTLMAELDLQNQDVDVLGARNQVTGLFLASWRPKPFLMLDVGLGHHDPEIDVKNLDKDALDVNLHYFLQSHIELLLTNRIQALAFGEGGRTTGFTLLQLHYRL